MNTASYDKATTYLDVIRNMILHENELINQRLSWMFALQGLLFAAIGFLWCIHLVPVVIIKKKRGQGLKVEKEIRKGHFQALTPSRFSRQFNISRKTGYKWLVWYEKYGP